MCFKIRIVRRRFESVMVSASFAIALSAIQANAVQAPFTEEAAARGVNYFPFFNGVFGQDQPYGGGAAFADLDGDGDPDIVTVGAASGVVGFFENNGAGYFTDRSSTSGAPLVTKGAGVCAADYDRDGDLDIFISGWKQANVLLRNNGNFTFTDVALAAGVRDFGTASNGSCWGDYNLDGWVDLHVCNYLEPNRMFRNNGNGTFTDMAAALGLIQPWPVSLQSAFVDIDRDGDSDLYIASDKGSICQSSPNQRNYLYLNNGGTFTEIAVAANAVACADAMSISIGDIDHNRHLDFYITNIAVGNKLLCNQGNNTFLNEEANAGVESFLFAWGAEFFDFDNDTNLDLYVCNQNTNNRFYYNSGTWPLSDQGAALGVNDAGQSFGILSADVDNDGDLDLLVHNNNSLMRLYINHEGELRHWAKFDVVGLGSERYAIGTRIDVRTGSLWQIREVLAGHNYKTQNDLVQHVGLAAAASMDEVVVTWPGGTVTRTLTNYAADQTWKLIPPAKLGDSTGDSQRTFDDYLDLLDCFTGPNPGSLSAGCEMFDFDGDADVDAADAVAFVNAFDGVVEDCNNNSVADMLDIINGTSPDSNQNGVPDECQKLGDLDGSGFVNVSDLFSLLAHWGACPQPCPPACIGDLGGAGGPDCNVNVSDLFILLSNWG